MTSIFEPANWRFADSMQSASVYTIETFHDICAMTTTVWGVRQIAKTSVQGIKFAQNLADDTALAVHSLATLKLFITILDGRNLADNWLEFKERFSDQGVVMKAAHISLVAVNVCRFVKCLGALNIPYFSTLAAVEKTIPIFGIACTFSLGTIKDTTNTVKRVLKSIDLFLNPEKRKMAFGTTPKSAEIKLSGKKPQEEGSTSSSPPPPPGTPPSSPSGVVESGNHRLERFLLLAEFSIDTGKIVLFVATGGMGLVAGIAILPATGTAVLATYLALEILGIALQIGRARYERQQKILNFDESVATIKENIEVKLFACESCYILLEQHLSSMISNQVNTSKEKLMQKYREIQEEKHISVQQLLHEVDEYLKKLELVEDSSCDDFKNRLKQIRSKFDELYRQTNQYCESVQNQSIPEEMMESGDFGS